MDPNLDWQQLIQEQVASGKTQAEFCKEKGISPGAFRNRKTRLGANHRQKSKFIKAKVKSLTQSSTQSPVVGPSVTSKVFMAEDKGSTKSSLDPKWVAEFILHLHGGAR